MEARTGLDVRFGKRLKEARGTRDMSQAELCSELAAREITWYTSTATKVEAGARPVKLAELTALAEIFGVTADWLLARDHKPRRDRIHVLMLTADTAVRASDLLIDAVTMLADRLDELGTLADETTRAALITGLQQAHTLLTDANAVLSEVGHTARQAASVELKGTQR
jgi:transcriptional regulator with XRE-family HTH domain